MKKILMALTITLFVSTIQAAERKIYRAPAKKTKVSDENSLNDYHPALTDSIFDNEASPKKSSKKETISILKAQIAHANESVKQLHDKIREWTIELAPLETIKNHNTRTKSDAKTTKHNFA